MKPVRITTLAQTEIDAAASWFERRKEGIGIEFYQRVDEAAKKIERNPEGFQKLYKDMRHVNLEQFKEWGLFFRIRDDGSIVARCNVVCSALRAEMRRSWAYIFPRRDFRPIGPIGADRQKTSFSPTFRLLVGRPYGSVLAIQSEQRYRFHAACGAGEALRLVWAFGSAGAGSFGSFLTIRHLIRPSSVSIRTHP